MNRVLNIIEKLNFELKVLKKKDYIISFFRLFFFVLLIVFFYFYLVKNDNKWLLYFLSILVLFFVLFFYNSGIQKKIEFIKNKILVCNETLLEYINKNHTNSNFDHEFCFDLDIIGLNSVLSYLDKTQTIKGFNKLKEKLLNLNLSKEKIIENQNSIKELSNKIEWDISFLAKMKEFDSQVNFNTLKITNSFSKYNKLFTVISIINVLLLGLFLILPITFYTVCIVLFPVLIYSILFFKFRKGLNKQFKIANISSKTITPITELLCIIEKESFDSEILLGYKKTLFNSSQNAIVEIKKLNKLLNLFENRKIPVFGLVVNVFLLWDFHITMSIEKQLRHLEEKIDVWQDIIFEIESLISFSLYAFKNNDFIYPKVSNNSNTYTFEEIAHPLLNKNEAVTNDFFVNKNNSITIITGANMTGKSTFLRAIGVNLVLAMNGCPVSAKEFIFYPTAIFSSMRTSDSLYKGSSYFNAEITKLKTLIEKLQNKEPQFIILDEILKGTNSLDKLNGSKLFIEKLIKSNTNLTCIIATHDLDLTDMINKYPNNITNQCFELNEKNNELIPDYKLRNGVTKTMNAMKLLRDYKIID